MKILYTALATTVGGREGHGETEDGKVSVDFSLPAEMGGKGGGGTNPEQLFATGYSACFGSALAFVADREKIDPGKITVFAQVGIGRRDEGGFGFEVKIEATLGALEHDVAEKLVAKAHAVCPYSNAIKNNVPVSLVAKG